MKYFILCFSLVIFACGQSEISDRDINLDEYLVDELASDSDDLPAESALNGDTYDQEIVCERYTTGDKKIVCYYNGYGANEVIVKRIHYHKQTDGGGVSCEQYYDDQGKTHGTLRWYHENGVLAKIGTWEHGIAVGKHTTYSKGGNVLIEIDQDSEDTKKLQNLFNALDF